MERAFAGSQKLNLNPNHAPTRHGALFTTTFISWILWLLCVCVSHSVVSDSLRPHELSMKFSRQEYWSGLPFPSPGDLPNPGFRTRVSCIADRCFTVWATREAGLGDPGIMIPTTNLLHLLKIYSKAHQNFERVKWGAREENIEGFKAVMSNMTTTSYMWLLGLLFN